MLEDKSILIVDDDLTLAETYEKYLKDKGAVVRVAHDGDEAIKIAKENHPSLILLDLMMPKVSGFEVLRTLKGNNATKDIPIIILTVLLDSDKYAKAMNLKADAYIIKSETMPPDVIAKIETLLDKK